MACETRPEDAQYARLVGRPAMYSQWHDVHAGAVSHDLPA